MHLLTAFWMRTIVKMQRHSDERGVVKHHDNKTYVFASLSKIVNECFVCAPSIRLAFFIVLLGFLVDWSDFSIKPASMLLNACDQLLHSSCQRLHKFYHSQFNQIVELFSILAASLSSILLIFSNWLYFCYAELFRCSLISINLKGGKHSEYF